MIWTAGSSCRNASAATSSPASTHGDFARMTPRACWFRSITCLGRHVAPAEVLGQRRRTSSRYCPGSSGSNGTALTQAGSSANSSCASATVTELQSRMCVAAWKSRAAGCRAANAARQHRVRDDRLGRLLQMRLDAPHLGERTLRRLANRERPIVLAADRRDHFVGCRPRRRGAQNPAATTTRPLRSRTGETAQTAAAAPTAPRASRCWRTRRPRRPEVAVAAATSPARDNRRRTPRKTLRSARARARSRMPRTVPSILRQATPARQHPAVQRLGDRPARLRLHQREASGVQDLDREPPSDLHLRRYRTPRRCPAVALAAQ